MLFSPSCRDLQVSVELPMLVPEISNTRRQHDHNTLRIRGIFLTASTNWSFVLQSDVAFLLSSIHSSCLLYLYMASLCT